MTLKIVRTGEAGMDPNVECSAYARPREYWDGIAKTDWHLPADSINKPQQESMEKLLPKLRAARWINIVIRKDGVETNHEGDWIKHIRKAAPTAVRPREFVRITAADFNGTAFDGRPFEPADGSDWPSWLEKALIDGRITLKADGRDYALWNVKTRYRTVVAEPGDRIIDNEDGTLSVLIGTGPT